MLEKIEELADKCDKILIVMTIRFTKEVQIRYFQEMNNVYREMEYLDQKMMSADHD